MSALPALVIDGMKKENYMVYVSDRLMDIENAIIGGNVVEKRYYDIITQNNYDTRSGDEIALDVIEKAGLKVVN